MGSARAQARRPTGAPQRRARRRAAIRAFGASLLLTAFCTAAASAAGEPVEVLDDTGTRLALPQPALRIVSLAPSITEQLFAIGAGDRIVGTSAYSDYPPAAGDIPVVSGIDGVDLERVASLHPDLVILWGSGYPPATRGALERLGVPVYVSEPDSLESIARSMERLGRITGASQAAARARQFRERLQQLRRTFAGRSPVRAFYQVWAQPLMTLSGRHVVSEALQACGARNIFSSLPLLVPTVSPEAVIAADPQVILTSEPGAVDHGGLEFWKRYPFLSAVAHGQLVTLDANLIDRATPRMLEETARLCQRIDAARQASR
jgi:iron complex transport system substrate-binding protein